MSILVVYTLLSICGSPKINSFQRTPAQQVFGRLVLDTHVPASKKLSLILIKAIAAACSHSHLQWRRWCGRIHAEPLSSFSSRQIECRYKGDNGK